VRAAGLRGLGDEDQLGAEGLGEVAHQAAQELLADGAGRALGDRAQQISAAEPRSAIMDGDGHRHARW
jgi:hypothetical protein